MLKSQWNSQLAISVYPVFAVSGLVDMFCSFLSFPVNCSCQSSQYIDWHESSDVRWSLSLFTR